MCLCVDCHRWWENNRRKARGWFKIKYKERDAYLERYKFQKVRFTEEEYKAILEAIKSKSYRHLTNHYKGI